ncbi:nuA3 HAT complex component Nto1p [[Candida] railenensis]|uniref:NuA3 HAT complex component Nto1p n=1 Tax=[Candida] railenensis TaxID=45579 RepID=A0A9P0QMF2_9ASCO|nr:nuA3 HAT complex component Nto1p [[Candida] railenensis]
MSAGGFPIVDTSKPREERDYKELYSDLDESDILNVYVRTSIENQEVNNLNGTGEPSPSNGNNANGEKHVDNNLKAPSFRKIAKPAFNHPKFSKTLVDYGFQDPSKPIRNHSSKTLTRPFSCDDIQEMAVKKQKLVEYDLDEQDLLYLAQRNDKSSNTIKLTPEIFEILITILENEWNVLELKLSSRENSSTNKGILKLDNGGDVHKYGNDDGIVEGSFMEQKCAVCNDSDCDNSNAIVFCDGCDIAVHQECYGIAFIPEGQWLCRKCMINKNREVHCIFCPSTTGAFKQLDSSMWSHVICALWITELYFANPIYMEPIEGVDTIPKNRWKLTCYICKKRNVGACIQCHNKNCFQAYHVTCAKRSGLHMKLTKGIVGAINNKATLRTYCDKHGGHDLRDHLDIMRGIEKTRLYFRDLKILNDKNAKILRKQEIDNKLNTFKWKTENDTPIAPHKFSQVLEDKLMELKVMERNTAYANGGDGNSSLKHLAIAPNTSKEMKKLEIKQITFDICKYWCLKRESKNGAPLTRKNNNMELSSIIYGSNEQEEINNKLEFGRILIEDLDRVLLLVENVVERQEILLTDAELSLDIIDGIYFPTRQVLLEILGKHRSSQSSTNSAGNSTIFDHLYENLDSYKLESNSVEAFVHDLRNICTKIISESGKASQITKLSKKILKELDRQNWQELDRKLLKDIDHDEILKLPYVNVTGSNVNFKEVNAYKELLREDLSEVESLNGDEESELDGLIRS